jgi:shikimate dehydrogenase
VLTALGKRIVADNTDGAGLVADLTRNLGFELRGSRILLLGAGGAARGVIAPLLACSPAEFVIANRTVAKARDLASEFASRGTIRASALDPIEGEGFDLVLNATSSSTNGEPLALSPQLMKPGAMAYDMAYGPAARSFVERARANGARATDGLGMLVEQAAEAFLAWHGVRPETSPVLVALRAA